MGADDYITAEEAAALLGVALDTFYVYVSRKGLRSQPTPNSRKRRYWREDVERLRQRRGRPAPIAGDINQESALTLITGDQIFYRGKDVADLAETASLEATAALLWGVEAEAVFTPALPAAPTALHALRAALADEAHVDQALALFPLLERANPRALDLSVLGTARTGADLLRWFAAIALGASGPVAEPIHAIFGKACGLAPRDEDLVRRLLVLSADHGMEPATFAVRAVASTGVSPWRAVPTGITVSLGQRSRLGRFTALGRMVSDILRSDVPSDAVVRRVREGDELIGFSARAEDRREPRAAILRAALRTYRDDPERQRLEDAIQAAEDIGGYAPTFALLSTFVWRKVGLKATNAPFLMARSAGWIAHSIEQYQAGERERREPHYQGPLPESVRPAAS